MNTLSEVLTIKGESLADVSSASTGVNFLDAKSARRFVAQAESAANIAANSNLSIKLVQAKDAAGTDAKDLSEAVVLVADVAKKLTVQADALSGELDIDGGFTHVGFTVETDGSAVAANAVIISSNNRYSL